MTINELPIEEQTRLRETKPAFVGRRINDIREVLVYDKNWYTLLSRVACI